MPWPPYSIKRVPRFLLAIDKGRLHAIADRCGADKADVTDSKQLAQAVIGQLVKDGKGPEELLGPQGFTDEELCAALCQLDGVDEHKVATVRHEELCSTVLAYWSQGLLCQEMAVIMTEAGRRRLAYHQQVSELEAITFAEQPALRGVVKRFLLGIQMDVLKEAYTLALPANLAEGHEALCEFMITKAKSRPFLVLEHLDDGTVTECYEKRAREDAVASIKGHAARISLMIYWQQEAQDADIPALVPDPNPGSEQTAKAEQKALQDSMMKVEWTDALQQGAKACLAACLSAGELAVLHLALTGDPGTDSSDAMANAVVKAAKSPYALVRRQVFTVKVMRRMLATDVLTSMALGGQPSPEQARLVHRDLAREKRVGLQHRLLMWWEQGVKRKSTKSFCNTQKTCRCSAVQQSPSAWQAPDHEVDQPNAAENQSVLMC